MAGRVESYSLGHILRSALTPWGKKALTSWGKECEHAVAGLLWTECQTGAAQQCKEQLGLSLKNGGGEEVPGVPGGSLSPFS